MLILMSIELMLNAVNINLVAEVAYRNGAGGITGQAFTDFSGQIIVIFIITVAAAEVGLALAIILRLFRAKSTINVDEVDLMKW